MKKMKIEDFFVDKESLDINYEKVNEIIPEFGKLAESKQNPKWHSEGNAQTHTVLCVKYAKENMIKEYDILHQRLLMIAVLLHDIGKANTTAIGKDNNWHSYGHEFESERIARNILWDNGVREREYICWLIRNHMEILKIVDSKHSFEKILQMASNGCLKDLIFVKECDITAIVTVYVHGTFVVESITYAIYHIIQKFLNIFTVFVTA